MLPFFFRHYDPLVECYVFYDDASSDATLEMLKAHPRVEIRRFERTTPDSFVLSAQSLQNAMWKESRGACDWVIVTAVDEHPDLPSYLAKAKRTGVTAIPRSRLRNGVSRVSGRINTGHKTNYRCSIPTPSPKRTSVWAGIRRGRTASFAIPIATSCSALQIARPRLLSRCALLRTGLGEIDRARGFGRHYNFSDPELAARHKQFLADAIEVMAPERDHHHLHTEPRWWRIKA